MRLQRGLRCEDDASAAGDVNGAGEHVAAENAGTRADEDDIRRAAEIVHASDPQRRLGIGMREERAAAPRFEAKLEPRTSTDRVRRPGIGRHATSRPGSSST